MALAAHRCRATCRPAARGWGGGHRFRHRLCRTGPYPSHIVIAVARPKRGWQCGGGEASGGAARSRSTAGGGDGRSPGRDWVHPDGSRPNPASASEGRCVAFVGEEPLGHGDSFPAAVSNLPGLEAAAAGNGFLNQFVDWDHVVRRVPLVLRLGEKPYSSLAAEALRLALGARSYVGRAAGANAEKSFGEKTGLTAIRIGQLAIPTDAAGRVWLHYAIPRRDRFVSAADVLAGRFDPALFADHIVGRDFRCGCCQRSAGGSGDPRSVARADTAKGISRSPRLRRRDGNLVYAARRDRSDPRLAADRSVAERSALRRLGGHCVRDVMAPLQARATADRPSFPGR